MTVRYFKFPFVGCLLWLASLATCRADLVIDIDSTSLGPNSNGYIEVFIHNEVGLGSVNLAGFDLSFSITDKSPVGQPASGSLFFLDSFDSSAPNNPQLQTNSEQAAANYVFTTFANIDNFYAKRDAGDPRLVTAGDSTFDVLASTYTNVPISNSPLLLARLEIGQSQPMGVMLARGQYQISLDVAGSQFYDAANPGTPSLSFRAGTNGLVNVSGIPEPSICSMLVTASLFALMRRTSRAKSTG